MYCGRVAVMLGNHIYIEKSGLSPALGQVPRQAPLFVQKTSLGLSWPHDGPASPLCQSRMGQEGEKTKLAALFVSVSGLSLCPRVHLFIFKCSGS